MRRRDFLTLLGGAAAALPLAAKAQQRVVPVVGWLNHNASGTLEAFAASFRQGLSEAGYVEGRNLAIEYRWAEGQFERLPALAADLVRRQVSVIFAGSPPAALAAKAATTSIPIVFQMGEDPIKEGIVTSLNRPGGNITGFTNFGNQLFAKRVGLLRDIVQKAAPIGFLVNPKNPNAEPDTRDVQSAADALRWQLRVLPASNEAELEAAFTAMVRQQVGALLVGVDGTFFLARREQIASLAARHRIPTLYDRRQYPEIGGLMSYGTNPLESYRQSGIYVGRILKGEKPGDLPVQQPTKFEFVINLKTARALSLDIPPSMLAIVDEVIE